jgi:hypothetical protein
MDEAGNCCGCIVGLPLLLGAIALLVLFVRWVWFNL